MGEREGRRREEGGRGEGEGEDKEGESGRRVLCYYMYQRLSKLLPLEIINS